MTGTLYARYLLPSETKNFRGTGHIFARWEQMLRTAKLTRVVYEFLIIKSVSLSGAVVSVSRGAIFYSALVFYGTDSTAKWRER